MPFFTTYLFDIVTLSENGTILPIPVIIEWTARTLVCKGSKDYLCYGGKRCSWSGPFVHNSNFQNLIIINVPTYMPFTFKVTGEHENKSIVRTNVFIYENSVNKIRYTSSNRYHYGESLYLNSSSVIRYHRIGPKFIS